MADEFYQAICERIGSASVRRDESMKQHTTFRIGGTADYYMLLKTEREWQEASVLCHQYQKPYTVIGNGSNLLVSDKGFSGVVISMEEGFGDIRVEESLIVAGAGALLSQVARRACEAELTGLEFAAGIPGTLGGGAVMNAGAYGGELKDVLTWVRVLNGEGREEQLSVEDLELGYRTSSLQRSGAVVLEAGLRLTKGKKEEIKQKMEELAIARKEKQPLEYPSAGSTFKRPQGYFAGKLIQDAGLRGKQIGGAQVSEKHCGFIINRDHASAQDIWELCACVVNEVRAQFKVELEMEVRVLGRFSGS